MGKKSIKREIIEWGILLAVGATLYFTGYHTEVIGFIQRAVLSTGIIRPDTDTNEKFLADYDFTLVNSTGREIPFETFKGQTVFLNFWATWCPPCIAEMPDIQSLYEKTNEQITFVMVSMDNDPEKAKQFVYRKGYDFPIYFLHSQVPSKYDIHSIPTTYILSPSGKIASENHGMAQYDSDFFIDFLLKLDSSASPTLLPADVNATE